MKENCLLFGIFSLGSAYVEGPSASFRTLVTSRLAATDKITCR